MKLPGIDYAAGFRRLPLEDPGAPVQTAVAWNRAAQAIGKTLSDIAVDQDIQQAHTSGTELEGEFAAAQQVANTRQTIPMSEVPGDIDIERSVKEIDPNGEVREIPKTDVPSHEVMGTMFSRNSRSAIDIQASKIRNSAMRKKFVAQMEGVRQRYQSNIDNIAAGRVRDISITTTMENAHQQRLLGNYGNSVAVIQADPFMPTKAKAAAVQKYKEYAVTDIYSEHMATDDVKSIQADLKELKAKKYQGPLDDIDRNTWVNKLEGDLSRIATKSSAAMNAELAMRARQLKQVNEDLKNNKFVSQEMHTRAKQNARFLSSRPGASRSDINLGMDYAAMASTEAETNTFLNQPPAVRERFLIENADKAKTAEQSAYLGRLQDAHERANIEERKDTMGYLATRRRIDLKPLALTAEGMQNGDFAKSLSSRIESAEAGFAQTSRFTGFLTDEEATTMGEMLTNMPIEQKLMFYKEVNKGLGNKASQFYAQFKDKLSAVHIAAGEVATFDVITARHILEGEKIRADNPQVVSKINSDFLPIIGEAVGSAYDYTDTSLESVTDAVINEYAYQMVKVKNDRSGSFNSKVLDKAIIAVTGGVMDVNGVKIKPPVPGMTDSRFIRWMRNTDPDYVGSLGSPAGYTNKRIMSGLIDGEFKLMGRSQNAYAIYDTNTDGFIGDSKTGTAFIFKYDVTAPKRPEAEWQGRFGIPKGR